MYLYDTNHNFQSWVMDSFSGPHNCQCLEMSFLRKIKQVFYGLGTSEFIVCLCERTAGDDLVIEKSSSIV